MFGRKGITDELKNHYMNHGQRGQWLATEAYLNVLDKHRSSYSKEQSEALRWAIDFIRSSKLPELA